MMKATAHIFLVLITAFILFSCKATIPQGQRTDPGAAQSSQNQYPPRIDSFEAFPAMFTEGDSIELSWETSHATEVYISGVGMVNPSGSHRIANVNFDQGDIMLTATNDGNFAPATEKLNMKVVLFAKQVKLPNGFRIAPNTPFIMVGDRATLSNNIRQYNLKPVNKYAAGRYSQIKPLSTGTSTSPAVNKPIYTKPMVAKPVYTKPMIAKPMYYSMAQLNAPQIISPKNNSTFSHYPRALKLRWRPVSNAASYNVEIDCMHCCAAKKWCADVGRKFKQINALNSTFYKFSFVGSQPGRWRVQAVDKNGKAGKQSQWYNFKFTR